MKKIYTKPSLHAEKFAVEGIMTNDYLNAFSSVTALYLGGTQLNDGSWNFTAENTLHISDYQSFKSNN